MVFCLEYVYQWRRNRNTIGGGGGGAGVRGCEAADYLCEVSAYEGEKLGVPYPPALDVYNH